MKIKNKFNPNKLGDCLFENSIPMKCIFEQENHILVYNSATYSDINYFVEVGQFRRLYFDPTTVRVGVLTAGGNAPGLNMVIDSIVKRHFNYGLKDKRQARAYIGGYKGLYEGNSVYLEPQETDKWAYEACTRIKTARGIFPMEKLVDNLQADEIDILYTIGGNGTLYWASQIHREIQRRGLKIGIVGGPKSMDNDINYAECTFGFRTTVDNAVKVIRDFHKEAESQDRIGLIQLFGANSGFVALHASYVSGEVDYVIIPERKEDLNEVLKYTEKRLKKNGHALIVVAEGALAHLIPEAEKDKTLRKVVFEKLVEIFKEYFANFQDGNHQVFALEPRHLIRGTEPNSFDIDLCKMTGKLMVEAGLAGYTNCVVNYWCGHYVLVPIPMAIETIKLVNTEGYYYESMIAKYSLT